MAIVNVLNMLNFKQFKIMTSGNLIIWYNKAVTLYMVTIFCKIYEMKILSMFLMLCPQKEKLFEITGLNQIVEFIFI
jgi:hypothetical protein